MLIRLRDLSSLSITDDAGARHRVADLLVRRGAPEVTHVLSRLSGLLERRGCAVRMSAFGTPDLGAGTWPAAFDDAAAQAPGTGGPVAVLCAPDDLPEAADVAAADGEADLVRLSTIDEQPVIAADGTQVGRVMDMVIDVQAARVAMLVLHDDGGSQRVVPTDAFARVDWEAPAVHLSCGADPVSEAPELHEVGAAIEGHWYNRVLAYYGVG